MVERHRPGIGGGRGDAAVVFMTEIMSIFVPLYLEGERKRRAKPDIDIKAACFPE